MPGYIRRRRRFFLLFSPLVALAAYSVLVEPRMLEFTEHEVVVENLPPAFDGFTIVQISDIHVGLFIRPKGLRRVVERVNSLQPDLVVMTGDYISRFPSGAEPTARALSGLDSRHGAYAVLGNHEYWVDAPRMTRALRDHGIDVLFNESRTIRVDDQSIRLVGLDDLWAGDTHYDKAFRGIPPGSTVIALAHNPDTVTALERGSVSLLLSGHTHGGMINLPWKGPLFTITNLGPEYVSGMFEINGIRTYVSRGMGAGAPVRFRCRPEAPVFILRRGSTL